MHIDMESGVIFKAPFFCLSYLSFLPSLPPCLAPYSNKLDPHSPLTVHVTGSPSSAFLLCQIPKSGCLCEWTAI